MLNQAAHKELINEMKRAKKKKKCNYTSLLMDGFFLLLFLSTCHFQYRSTRAIRRNYHWLRWNPLVTVYGLPNEGLEILKKRMKARKGKGMGSLLLIFKPILISRRFYRTSTGCVINSTTDSSYSHPGTVHWQGINDRSVFRRRITYCIWASDSFFLPEAPENETTDWF